MAKTRHDAGSISWRKRSFFAPCTLLILSACGGETESSIRRVGNDRPGVGDQSGGNLNAGGGPNGNGGVATGPLTTTGTGDGNANTAAKAFFNAKVFPALGPCVSCHASGTQGAPKFLDAEPDKAYTELGAYGLVQPESRLLKKGPHGAGKSAPGLDEAAKSVVLEWIARETKENGGKTTPSVLDKVALCMDKAQFETIGIQRIQTIQRPGTNDNRCTGCENTLCSSCHGDRATPFFMTIGSALGDQTFEMTKQQPFITKYFGVSNGAPVASNGLLKKMQAVNADTGYGEHPNFTIPANVQQRLDAFVNDTLARFKAGNCTGTPPATP